MPRLTRIFVKLAMLWLVVGLAAWLGSAFLPNGSRALQVTSFHLLTLGWLTQMVYGVAIWMFPKRKGDRPRGSEALGWATLTTLNLGVLVRLCSEPWAPTSQPAAASLVVGGALQLVSALGFVALMRGRIRGP